MQEYLLFKSLSVTCFPFSALNKSCGATIETDIGWIAAPDLDFDGKYDYNVNCSWTVYVDHSSIIEFRVLFVEIARSRGCKDDSLEVTICLNIIHIYSTRELIIEDTDVDVSDLIWWRQPIN